MSWFEVKVKYTKQLENGSFKRVTEPYLLAAITFTDAESRIYEELGNIIRGEFHVTSINREKNLTKIKRTRQTDGSRLKRRFSLLFFCFRDKNFITWIYRIIQK